MKVTRNSLRSIDLARDAGLSTQAVRGYERLGFIPPVERGPQGYRLYTQQHVHALRTARVLISGFGWESALRVMQAVHEQRITAAFALVDACHAALHCSREEIEQTLNTLRELSAALALSGTESDTEMSRDRPLRIRSVAQHLGVRVSAIRFWEEQGLVTPDREQSSRYRLYRERHIRTLQVIVLLRKASYNVEAIRSVLAQLANGSPEQALVAAEQRLNELSERSRRCAEATAALWAYIATLPSSWQSPV